jgi:NTP pyrophosphatase (non-canonical NTP hydrolase)
MAENLDLLIDEINNFIFERDWKKFHSPKNLAVSISVEANELLEHFQWLSENEAAEYCAIAENKSAIAEEIADVFIYILDLCETLELDPIEISKNKISLNNAKYPVDQCKGKSDKYTTYTELRKNIGTAK